MKTKEDNHSGSLPVVGIGASAGGLEAVIELLIHLTPDTGMAFVLIQHLDPTHESMLSAILAKKTKMVVKEAKEQMLLEADCFYIIPPNRDMTLIDGHISLVARHDNPRHMPIDKFFISLAEIKGENAIGVVLSGSATDGTLGLRAIKEADGLTIAQDQSAKFQSMPKSAIAEEVVDLVLAPKEIAFELTKVGYYLKSAKNVGAEIEEITDNVDIQRIFQQLKESTAVDFNFYKPASINRRMRRRMLLSNLNTFKEYDKYLEKHPEELQLLYNDILINVTSFFRDPETFDCLHDKLLPLLLKDKLVNEPLRIWVPACSTGQEVYSIAMILCEVTDKTEMKSVAQIFATDLSEKSVAKARLGLYTKSEVADISPERLDRFFDKTDGSFRIKKMIRDICVFATHNILKDPPFSHIDLISCCNLFIYLEIERQKKVLDTFHYSLNGNGALLLGKSETVGNSGKFSKQQDIDYKVNIYRRDISVRQAMQSYQRQDADKRFQNTSKPAAGKNKSELNLGQVVDHLLLSQFIIPSVVINQDFEILQFRGSTAVFLEPPHGVATFNLLKMARPDLRMDLRSAIHQSSKTGLPVKKSGLEVRLKDSIHSVAIEIVPVEMFPDTKYFLVLFHEYLPSQQVASASVNKKQVQKKLEEEIVSLKENMSSILEDRESANEALQVANEEIVSSNEEMQTVNEELQTSKEEMESSNEELSTVNEQLQIRNDQLTETLEYTDGIIATISEAMVILDKNLIIKSANASFYKVFKAKPEDTEGFYLFDLGNGQWNIPELRKLLLEVIPEKSFFNDFEIVHDFPGIGVKTMLLNARLLVQKVQKTALVFITIRDISDHVRAAKLLKKQEDWFHNMADNAPVMIWIAGIDMQCTFFNAKWVAFTQHTAEEERGVGCSDRVHPEDIARYLKVYTSSFQQREPFNIEYRLKRHDGVYRWLLDNGVPTFSDGEFTGYIGTCTDVNEQKMFSQELEQKVKERTNDLVEANNSLKSSNKELEQYAYIASHDLQEPLRKLQTFSGMLQKKYQSELPQGASDYIDKITHCSQRMSQLIEDLLNFSSVTNSAIIFVPTDLNEILKDVLEDFNLENLPTAIKTDKLPVIQAIPLQMKQLFHNLLSNSIKFKQENRKLEVSVSTRSLSIAEVALHRSLDTSLPYCEIVFKDNGIGFDQTYAEQIFVIFKRLHSPLNFKGTGIGLALCYKIAVNHHGEIFAVAKEGEGAAFHILLPVKI